jgi:ArsR family transcriptional regulator, arsenate/arsenite/antimonite-responsive transcriptional repressor
MAQNKSSLFDQDDIQLAAIAKALAHPARIRILKILLDSNVCMCGEIVELMPLAQATVSQHLKELKQAGLILGEIEGPKICYCLNPEVIEKVKDQFTQLFIKIQKGKNFDES